MNWLHVLQEQLYLPIGCNQCNGTARFSIYGVNVWNCYLDI